MIKLQSYAYTIINMVNILEPTHILHGLLYDPPEALLSLLPLWPPLCYCKQSDLKFETHFLLLGNTHIPVPYWSTKRNVFLPTDDPKTKNYQTTVTTPYLASDLNYSLRDSTDVNVQAMWGKRIMHVKYLQY